MNEEAMFSESDDYGEAPREPVELGTVIGTSGTDEVDDTDDEELSADEPTDDISADDDSTSNDAANESPTTEAARRRRAQVSRETEVAARIAAANEDERDVLRRIFAIEGDAEKIVGAIFNRRGRPAPEVREAIRLGSMNTEERDLLRQLLDVKDESIERLVSAVFAQRDEIRAALRWLLNSMAVDDPFDLANRVRAAFDSDTQRKTFNLACSVMERMGWMRHIGNSRDSTRLSTVSRAIYQSSMNGKADEVRDLMAQLG